jgi:hypothetical protein
MDPNTTRTDKSVIIKDIRSILKSENMHFLKREEDDGLWRELTDYETRHKISHALRDVKYKPPQNPKKPTQIPLTPTTAMSSEFRKDSLHEDELVSVISNNSGVIPAGNCRNGSYTQAKYLPIPEKVDSVDDFSLVEASLLRENPKESLNDPLFELIHAIDEDESMEDSDQAAQEFHPAFIAFLTEFSETDEFIAQLELDLLSND